MGTWAPTRPGIWAPTLVSLPDVAQNVAAFLLFGVFGVLSTSESYRRQSPRLVVRIATLATLFSATIETLQFYTSDRVGSLTDVFSAAVGAGIGAALVSAWQPRALSRSAKR